MADLLLLLASFALCAGMALSLGTASRAPMEDYTVVTTAGFDTSYPSGGYVLTPSMFGFSERIDAVIAIFQGIGYVALWNATNGSIELLADTGSGLVQVTGGTNMSAYSAVLIAFGV